MKFNEALRRSNIDLRVFSDLITDSVIHQYPEVGANKNLEETEFHQAMIVNADSMGYIFDINDDRPERIVKTMFTALATFLSVRKTSKADEAVMIEIQDVDGLFKLGAIVEYNINEENPDEPGNFSYTMTFNKEDIVDLEKRKTVRKYFSSDETFKSIMDKAAYDIGGFAFDREIFIYDACRVTVDTLLQILDHEAVEGQVVDIVEPGYFTASVAVNNGEKEFSITPDGHMKAIVKSDVMLGD